jgi:hypothetical protein
LTNFAAVLGDLQRRLALPQPARSRVLLEIADDMEGLYQYYLDSGLDEKAAHETVLREIQLTPEALAELIDVHTSAYNRFLDGLSERGRALWERGLLVILSVFVLSTIAAAMGAGAVFGRANIFVWPALGLLAVGLILGLERAYALYVRKISSGREAGRRLPALLGISIAEVTVGIGGTWLDLFRASMTVVNDPARLGEVAFEWMAGGTALLLVSMGGAIAVALWWLVLAAKTAAVEEEEAMALSRIFGASEEKDP